MSCSPSTWRMLLAALGAVLAVPSAAVAGKPPNDAFAAARPIAMPVTWITSLDQATLEPGEPVHVGEVTVGSVWFTFTPTYTRRVAVVVNPPDAGTVVSVYTGSDLASLRPIGSAPMVGVRRAPYVAWEARVGETYRVAVALRTKDLTFEPWLPMQLRLLDPRPLATNVNFRRATAISLPYRAQGNLLEAPWSEGDAGVGPKSVWFKLRTRRTLGVTVVARPAGSVEFTCHDDDVFIHAFTGAQVVALKPVGGWFGGMGSGRWRFVARAGVLYHLAITCPFALDYRITVTGRPLEGSTLQVDPAWKAQFLDNGARDEVAWLRGRHGSLGIGLSTWKTVRVNVGLWQGATRMTLPAEIVVRRNAPAGVRLQLTPQARRTLRGVRRFDGQVRVEVAGATVRTLPVHLHMQRRPSLG